MIVFTGKCRKVGFVIFAAVLVIPETSRLAGDGLQADKFSTLLPNGLTC